MARVELPPIQIPRQSSERRSGSSNWGGSPHSPPAELSMRSALPGPTSRQSKGRQRLSIESFSRISSPAKLHVNNKRMRVPFQREGGLPAPFVMADGVRVSFAGGMKARGMRLQRLPSNDRDRHALPSRIPLPSLPQGSHRAPSATGRFGFVANPTEQLQVRGHSPDHMHRAPHGGSSRRDGSLSAEPDSVYTDGEYPADVVVAAPPEQQQQQQQQQQHRRPERPAASNRPPPRGGPSGEVSEVGREVGGSEVRGEISHASSAEEALASQSSPTAAVYEGQPAAPASGGTEERLTAASVAPPAGDAIAGDGADTPTGGADGQAAALPGHAPPADAQPGDAQPDPGGGATPGHAPSADAAPADAPPGDDPAGGAGQSLAELLAKAMPTPPSLKDGTLLTIQQQSDGALMVLRCAASSVQHCGEQPVVAGSESLGVSRGAHAAVGRREGACCGPCVAQAAAACIPAQSAALWAEAASACI